MCRAKCMLEISRVFVASSYRRRWLRLKYTKAECLHAFLHDLESMEVTDFCIALKTFFSTYIDLLASVMLAIFRHKIFPAKPLFVMFAYRTLVSQDQPKKN